MSTSTPAVQEQKQLAPVARLKNIINAPTVQEQFKNAMAENSSLFVASIIDLYASDTYLQKCDPGLVVAECLKAATLKLPINKSLGFAYVVPYKGVPQFQIGYRGFIQLAMRSGIYKIINADVVLEGELVGISKLTGEVDLSGEPKSDTVTGYFAHIETTNGFKKTLYMSKIQTEEHGKKYSASYGKDSSPWKKNPDQMGVKTVLRLLLGKYGQLSVEMATAIGSDEEEALSPVGQLEMDMKQHANKQLIDMETGEITEISQQKIDEIMLPPTDEQQSTVPDDGPGY
jgi:recombination protein RecT